MLKKAGELSLLCGIQISVIFTDVSDEYIHFYNSNSENMEELLEKLRNSTVFSFTNEDVINKNLKFFF